MRYEMAGHKRKFGGSNDLRSGRNEFGNVHFGGSNKIQSGRNEFNNVFFRGDREVDHNKTQFNRSGAFDDGASYFTGGSPDTFAHSHDRNIVYNASGCGQMNARGKKRPPINPFTPTTLPYNPYGARNVGAPECISDDDCGTGCFCRDGRCLCGDPTGRKKKLYGTQADDPANRRKLNAKGRAAGLPKARRNEDIRDYARRAGINLSDPQGVIGERAACDCRCVGTGTGEGGGAYSDMPNGTFINCCEGNKCAWVAKFGERAGEVQPLSALKKPRPSGSRPSKSGKPVAKGSGKVRKTKKGLFLVNDIGDDIPITPQEQSHPCCNSGNLCSSNFNCLDGSGSYPIMGCCGSYSYCSGLGAGEGNPCGGAYEIVPSPASPNLQGSANFRGRDLSNGGFRLR